MTKREYHDILVKCSETGLFPSMKESYCAYRGLYGRKCAAGILIPDEEYDPRFEKIRIQNLDDPVNIMGDDEAARLLNDCIKKHIPEGMTLGDIIDCQGIHDKLTKGGLFQWDHSRFVYELKRLECFKEYYQCEFVD